MASFSTKAEVVQRERDINDAAGEILEGPYLFLLCNFVTRGTVPPEILATGNFVSETKGIFTTFRSRLTSSLMASDFLRAKDQWWLVEDIQDHNRDYNLVNIFTKKVGDPTV